MSQYHGRFAPTPSGELHYGSLMTALASYADAKSQQGKWSIRIDNIDLPRVKPTAEKAILSQLEKMGFEWDDEISYQNKQADYDYAITRLKQQHNLYPCYCTRKQIKQMGLNGQYSGKCQNKTFKALESQTYAIRVRRDDRVLALSDRVQGKIHSSVREDFIIKRADNIISYQLASVIDDYLSGFNQIVRGYDLLESSFNQTYLHQLLEVPEPSYTHIPILLDQNHHKLSKSSNSPAVKGTIKELFHLAKLLGQKLPANLSKASISEFWSYLISHWNIDHIPKTDTLKFSFQYDQADVER